MAEQKAPNFKPISIEKGNTPKGTAIFPWLNTPDTKFKAEGDFRVKLRLTGQAAEDFSAKVDEMYDKAISEVAKAKDYDAKKKKAMKLADKPYKQATDKEGNDIEGAIDFTFKSKASFKNKAGEVQKRSIPMFDAKGKPVKALVYGGSELKVRFDASAFFTPLVGAGLTMRLDAIQIIELKTGGQSGDADAYGFDEEEGFEGEAPAAGSAGGTTDDDVEF